MTKARKEKRGEERERVKEQETVTGASGRGGECGWIRREEERRGANEKR